MTRPERVVFDCNVYFQAVISASGPANRLLRLAAEGRLTLYASTYILDELRVLTSDPRVRMKYCLEDATLDEFFAMIRQHAMLAADVPHVFDLPRDPDDAHYVDLAVAVDAKLIVSRDKDLLSLRDAGTAEGRDFLSRFPTLLILTPPEALKLLASDSAPA
ncbi:MAG: putative toxin-antitoxin system toxin component, PIN family [Pirellulales bacterium]